MIQYISKIYLKEVKVLLRFVSSSVSDTEAIAERLGKTVNPGTVIAYFGGLGMGKTAFTRARFKLKPPNHLTERVKGYKIFCTLS